MKEKDKERGDMVIELLLVGAIAGFLFPWLTFIVLAVALYVKTRQTETKALTDTAKKWLTETRILQQVFKRLVRFLGDTQTTPSSSATNKLDPFITQTTFDDTNTLPSIPSIPLPPLGQSWMDETV